MEKEIKQQPKILTGLDTESGETPKYLKVGEVKIIDGHTFVKPGYIDDGFAFGDIFKDEEVYNKDWGAVCYVPEQGFDNDEKDADDFYYVTGYTHNELLDLCGGNRELCDYLFEKLMWACPETYLNELDDEDISYYYRFIKPGAKVWWNDPEGETSGEYTVFNTPFEFDDKGELISPESFDSNGIILIGNEVSEVEVTPFELTPIY